MSTMELPEHLTTPEAVTRLLKGLGYPEHEIVAGIAKRFEISPTAARRVVSSTVVA